MQWGRQASTNIKIGKKRVQECYTGRNILDLYILWCHEDGKHQQPYEPKSHLALHEQRSRHVAWSLDSLGQAHKAPEVPYGHKGTKNQTKRQESALKSNQRVYRYILNNN